MGKVGREPGLSNLMTGGITELINDSNEKFYVGSADPSNIWKKDGRYYMLTGNLLLLQKYGSLREDAADVPLPDDSLNYQGDRLYLFSFRKP